MPLKHDFLKYWRVVRYYVKAKHGLSTPDMEMMLFLYSEKYFSRANFKEYSQIMAWDRNRFDRLRTQGWITIFREPNRRAGVGAIYRLSPKASEVIKSIYQFLLGNIPLSSKAPNTRLANKSAGYADKTYLNMIKKMNREYRKLRDERSEEL
tara:strand:+ start:4150 stop:4605 length:456 start_codon:yes stop_codon:yes gene_type:complete